MTDEPTTGEIMRRLDEVSRQMVDLASQLRLDRAEASKTYVRQDVWSEARKFDQAVTADLAADVRQIQKERDADVGFRRQVVLALVVAAIGSLTALGLAVLNLIARTSG